jgi:hypothetical protein
LVARELRRAIAPVLESWGFANPPKGNPGWFPTTRRDAWVRIRDGHTEEIYVVWGRNEPRFRIHIRTDRAVRMRAPAVQGPMPRVDDIELLSWRFRTLWGRIDARSTVFACFHDFVGFADEYTLPYLRYPVSRALRRLEEGNRYLLTGDLTKHILLGRTWWPAGADPSKDFPIFPEREGGPDGYAERKRQFREEHPEFFPKRRIKTPDDS